MSMFKLPDLGEGLPDAEIHEWFVKVGDTIQKGQPLVAMETAKAVVEVPSPQNGTIAKLFGLAGEIIKTGSNLVQFQDNQETTAPTLDTKDQGTVVGHLPTNINTNLEHITINNDIDTKDSPLKIATSQVRLFAAQNQINLREITGSGAGGLITMDDLKKHLSLKQNIKQMSPTKAGNDFNAITGVRRHMLQAMQLSHKHVVPVSVFDEINIANWPENSDLTVNIILAIIKACQKEPLLNAWFDNNSLSMKVFKEINLGLAVDSDDGLFVPVIHHADQMSAAELREKINQYKQDIKNRTIDPSALQGATITLSNFGKFAGQFASPIIIPPQVAIIAIGRKILKPVIAADTIVMQPYLPISLTFDHRAITGGEATRFLKQIIE